MPTHLRRAWFIALGYLSLGTDAAAQPPATLDKPITFVHGFNSNGTTWLATQEQIRRDMRARTFAPSLSALSSMNIQAGEVNAQIEPVFGSSSTVKMPFVAHSQGGPVARAYARLTNPHINGLATIGSPHQGTPIAYHALTGEVFLWLDWVYNNALYPIQWYEANDPEFGLPPSGIVGSFAIDLCDSWVLNLLNPWVPFICGFGICQGISCAPAQPPSICQHAPNSAFHQQLVTTAAVEPQVLSTGRVSIVGTVSSTNAMWRLAGDNVANAMAVSKAFLQVAYGELFFDYLYHPNYLLAANAGLWLDGIDAILDMDDAWSTAVAGAPNAAHDGFIPAWSQRMVNETAFIPVANVIHTKETLEHVPIRQAMQLLGVELRPAGSVAVVVPNQTAVTVTLGTNASLTAQARDVLYNVLNGKTFSWQSRSPVVAAVTTSGVVTGLAPGAAVLEVISEGYGALVDVTVVAGAPLTGVTIGGPSSGYSSQPSYFTATPAGGTTPFAYSWSVDGTVRQTGSSSNFSWTAGSSYTLEVVVTHAGTGSAMASRFVTITNSGQQAC
jgi:hypothetical protein